MTKSRFLNHSSEWCRFQTECAFYERFYVHEAYDPQYETYFLINGLHLQQSESKNDNDNENHFRNRTPKLIHWISLLPMQLIYILSKNVAKLIPDPSETVLDYSRIETNS